MHPLIAPGVLALFLAASALLCGTSNVAAQQRKADDAGKAGSTDKDSPRVSLHYLDGLSAASRDTPQDIRFLPSGCPLSLLLTNTTKGEIHLWKPNCPQGDDAIRLEFKRDTESKEIDTARMAREYTGGSGRPRTMKLAPDDSLICQIDLSSSWSLPFVLKPGAKADLLVRAVYESKPIASHKSPLAPHADTVWNGRIQTEWERVRIGNITDSEAPKGHQGANLLE
jgi:hypothetical protein